MTVVAVAVVCGGRPVLVVVDITKIEGASVFSFVLMQSYIRNI